MAVALFALRSYRRLWYAYLEISFALYSGHVALSKIDKDGIAEWATLAAAAYLLVRGLDNFIEGLKQNVARRKKEQSVAEPDVHQLLATERKARIALEARIAKLDTGPVSSLAENEDEHQIGDNSRADVKV
jgi:hypothetical protein